MSSPTDQWFDAWRDLLSKQPWQSTLETWWRQFAAQGDAPPSPVFEKIAAQCHSFYQLAEELMKLDSGGGAAGSVKGELDRLFDDLKQAQAAQVDDPARSLFWQLPLAGWQRFATAIPGMAGGPFPETDSPTRGLDTFLSAPGLGYTREPEADAKKLTRLSLRYLEAQRRYNDFFADMSRGSLDLLRRRLTGRVEAGEAPLTSVREFYDLWVECSESVYRERVMSDEYSRLNGEMINALMMLKRHGDEMLDGVTGRLNMPTREELDTMQRRAHVARRDAVELERELRSLRERESELERRLEALSERVEARTTTKKGKAKSRTGKSGAGRKDAGARGKSGLTGTARYGSKNAGARRKNKTGKNKAGGRKS